MYHQSVNTCFFVLYGVRNIMIIYIIKVDSVAPLVADPPLANYTIYTDTHLLSDKGHTMVNHVFHRIEKFSHRYRYTPLK